jgi:hypothetical protein
MVGMRPGTIWLVFNTNSKMVNKGGRKNSVEYLQMRTRKQWKWIQTECQRHSTLSASEIFYVQHTINRCLLNICVDQLACDKF